MIANYSGILAAIYFLFILIGCARGIPPDPLSPGIVVNSSAGDTKAEASKRYLWGYWNLIVEPGKVVIDIIPVRLGELHANVLKFLETDEQLIGIDNFKIKPGTIEFDVRLTHPFPNYSQYSGFDVRGIIIAPGSVSGYSDAGIIHASQDDYYLNNADGYTRWWNPSEFTIGNTIFNYKNGKLGVEYKNGNLSSTLNGYKYFSDDLSVNDDLSALDENNRGCFRSTSTNIRHYIINRAQGSPLIFNYAVDASWWWPSPNPPKVIPGDFPIVANAPEAYRIESKIVENDLFYVDSSHKGGHVTLNISVYDWAGCSNTITRIESAGMWNASGLLTGGNDQYSSYEFDLDGSLLSSNEPVTALISAESQDALYGSGSIQKTHVTSYQIISIPVSAEPNPLVISIEPDHGQIEDKLIGVEIKGFDFAPNALVTLVKNPDAAAVIDATNENVVSGDIIHCDLFLDPSVIVPGKYDVIVTNPDSGLYANLDNGFEVLDKHPWPSLRGGGLNQGASKNVAYGSPGALTTPKWTYTIPSYQNGLLSSIVSRDGTIYICKGRWPSDIYCALYAINSDGTLKWVFSIPGTHVNSFCPVLDKEGFVYVSIGIDKESFLYKVDPVTGISVWSCSLGIPTHSIGSLSIGLDGAIYVFTGYFKENLIFHRIKSDGTPDWKFDLGLFTDNGPNREMSATILPDGNILIPGAMQNKIFCFKPDGTKVWEYVHYGIKPYLPEQIRSPIVAGPEGNIYFQGQAQYEWTHLYAVGPYQTKIWSHWYGCEYINDISVNPVNGNIVWTGQDRFMCYGPPAGGMDGIIYWDLNNTLIFRSIIDGNGDIIACKFTGAGDPPDNYSHCILKLSGNDGSVIWQSDNIQVHGVGIDPGYISIGKDGTIYLTCKNEYDISMLVAFGN
jgi:hypothetical protein